MNREVGWAWVQGATGSKLSGSSNVQTSRTSTGLYVATLTDGQTYTLAETFHFTFAGAIPEIPSVILTSPTVCGIEIRNRLNFVSDADFTVSFLSSDPLPPGANPSALDATMTPVAAPSVTFAGAHLADPHGLPVTAVRGVVATRLEGGRAHPVLSLQASGALSFPDSPGWLVLRFGRRGQAGPVRYLGRLSSTDLRLDAGQVLPATVEVGDDVTLLSDRTMPVQDPARGWLYVTAAPAGRAAAERVLRDTVAGGVDLVLDVAYPSDRGLGAEGAPTSGAARLSGNVTAFAEAPLDEALAAAREGV